MQSVTRLRKGFDRSNIEAAKVIVADIQKFGGEGALIVIWARQVLGQPRLKAQEAAA